MKPLTKEDFNKAVDKVAQAICSAANCEWDRLEPVYRSLYRRMAEAAIAAMPPLTVKESAVVRIDVDTIHRKVGVSHV